MMEEYLEQLVLQKARLKEEVKLMARMIEHLASKIMDDYPEGGAVSFVLDMEPFVSTRVRVEDGVMHVSAIDSETSE